MEVLCDLAFSLDEDFGFLTQHRVQSHFRSQ